MTLATVDTQYGAAFIGLILSAVLYGVTLLQTYLYFRQYPKDSWFIKFLVVTLWLLDTTHLFLCTIAIYSYLVRNFNNPIALERSIWSMNLQTDCNGLIAFIVQCFFARRVWIMSRNYLLVITVVILAAIHFVLGIYFTIQEFVLVDINRFGALIWVTCTGLGSAAAADVIIAVSLCYYLTKSRTGFARTDSLITTLIIYSLTTGLITSLIAFICVITFAIMPTNFIWLGFFWLIGKCYVNSFLAALNSRESLREVVAPQDGTFLQLTPFRAVGSVHNSEPRRSGDRKDDKELFSGNGNTTLAVTVQTQTITRCDYEHVVSTPVSATEDKFEPC